MRYTTPVYFQRTTYTYDEQTGDYLLTTTETERLASVIGTTIEAMKIVYGTIKQGAKTIHLQNIYSEPFDSIRIGDKSYNVDFTYPHPVKQAFIVSEVQ